MMEPRLKDILSHLPPGADAEALLRYLQGRLSPEDEHELEKEALDDPFTADALEGLDAFKDKKNLHLLVAQLNRDLKKKTEKKKRWRQRLQLHIEWWMIVAIVVILFVAVAGYFIHYYSRH